MMYTRSQNYTNQVVGKHGIHTFKGVVVMLLFLFLSFDVFVPTSGHPVQFFGQVVCPNILGYQFCEINKKHHDACTNLSICFVLYVEKGCNFIHNM